MRDLAKFMLQSKGFTLLEVVVVTLIISLLAAVAVPSYKNYIINAAEASARAKVLSTANDIETWASNTLTYKGFDASYLDNTGLIRYLPDGSSSSNYDYALNIVDVIASSDGKVSATKALNSSDASGRQWRIFASPNPRKSIIKNSMKYYFDSFGNQCAFSSSTSSVTIKTANVCKQPTKKDWK